MGRHELAEESELENDARPKVVDVLHWNGFSAFGHAHVLRDCARRHPHWMDDTDLSEADCSPGADTIFDHVDHRVVNPARLDVSDSAVAHKPRYELSPIDCLRLHCTNCKFTWKPCELNFDKNEQLTVTERSGLRTTLMVSN
jgi:hypothetical protein